jgi:DNA-binding transcriptional LysR family regulator
MGDTLNTREFLYVVTVYEEGSLTKAAKKLFLTQPSLSKYIINLEDSYEMRIFDRSTVPWSLTDFGVEYIKVARETLCLNRHLEQKAQDIRDFKTGKLSVGIPVTRAAHLLPELLPVFQERYPNIKIKIIEESSSVLEELLLRGTLDLLIFYQDDVNPLLNYQPIYKEKLYLVTAPGYISGAQPGQMFYDIVYNRSLEEKKFILLHEKQRTRKIAERIFADYKIKPQVQVVSRQLEVVAKLCINGMGITFVTETLRNGFQDNTLYQNADYYPLDQQYDIPIVAATRKDSYVAKIGQCFIDLAKEIYVAPKS